MEKAASNALISTGLDIGAVDIRVQSNSQKNPQFIVNPPDYKNAIKAGKEIYIQFYYVTPEVESLMIKALAISGCLVGWRNT